MYHYFFNHPATTELSALSLPTLFRSVASGGGDNLVCLWDTAGKKLHTLKGHTDQVSGVAFSGDGKLLAADLRSEEHTSELQSQPNYVCRLMHEKKKHPS